MTGRKRRSFTAEFKAEAVRLVTEKHYSVREAAESLGIGENLLRRWKDKQAKSADNAAETNGAGLHDELRRLRAENKRLFEAAKVIDRAVQCRDGRLADCRRAGTSSRTRANFSVFFVDTPPPREYYYTS
jgi:transposase